jgi:peptide/nickel transport system permease protein
VLKFVIRRVASGVLLLFVITTLAYALLYVGGGNIARRLLGQGATQEQVAAKAHALGLDRPVLTQYVDWLSHAVRGDFGRSWFNGQLVSVLVGGRLSVTLLEVTLATVLAAVVAVIIGVAAAVRGGWVDRVVQVVAVLGYAIPGFLLALGFILVFAVNLGWFRATYNADTVGSWARSMTLPVVALSIAALANVTLQLRGALIDGMRADYVRTLRSRGLGFGRTVYKHVMRNAAAPALAVLAVQFIGLIGGSVIVEQIFVVPGLGQMAVTATTNTDIPLVMGIVVATAVIVVVTNLVIDLAQSWLNPKVRLS